MSKQDTKTKQRRRRPLAVGDLVQTGEQRGIRNFGKGNNFQGYYDGAEKQVDDDCKAHRVIELLSDHGPGFRIIRLTNADLVRCHENK